MDDLARRSSSDRAAVFATAAAERGIPASHVEKDFWVCWMLQRLFSPPLVQGMVFKGGTSLTKVWKAINRFSEDIDLTLPQSGIPGGSDIRIKDEDSATQRKKSKEKIDGLLADWCGGSGRQEVGKRISVALSSNQGWDLRNTNDAIEFQYPRGLSASEYGDGYVRPIVLLEFGMVMPTEPAEDRLIAPYAATAGKYQMAKPNVSVRTLASERTFWEKVTLVHSENNRDNPKTGERLSRHYADVAALTAQEIGARALAKLEMLPEVARQKERYFHTGWARYEDAAKGHLLLVPPATHERALRRDYAAMREMYYGDVLPFDTILERLARLQEIVRRRSS